MTDDTKVKRWDTTGYRVLPQPERGGDAFGLVLAADDDALDWAKTGRGPMRGEWRRYAAGEIALHVPAHSVAGLLAEGVIVKAGGEDDPYGEVPKPITKPPPVGGNGAGGFARRVVEEVTP